MAIDATDLGALEKALNDAAGKASVLWTTFVTFELYLAIAFGSVKHRDLFLENPVKLPILNVDLPLVAFFVVAPVMFVIFHFYIFLQIYALAKKARNTTVCSSSRFGSMRPAARPAATRHVPHLAILGWSEGAADTFSRFLLPADRLDHARRRANPDPASGAGDVSPLPSTNRSHGRSGFSCWLTSS